MDANYQFMFADIGKPGSFSDARIWQDSKLKQALDSGALNLPDPVGNINYHFIGDDIFPLTVSLMKPFSRGAAEMAPAEKIFNYRYPASRTTKVVEYQGVGFFVPAMMQTILMQVQHYSLIHFDLI